VLGGAVGGAIIKHVSDSWSSTVKASDSTMKK
jgi:hypothetical protein